MEDNNRTKLLPLDITRSLTGVMFEGISVWADGEDNELFVYFEDVPIRYVWNMETYTLKIDYYGLEGMVSYSLFDYIDAFPALDIFRQLVLAARECDEQRVSFRFCVKINNPRDVNVYRIGKDDQNLQTEHVCVMMYPR